MASIFDKLGIRFQYPENWTLDESEALTGDQSVTVYSPGGAFWSVIIRPVELAPKKLADAALATMRDQYDELDSEAVVEKVAGKELIGYDMNFYCLDLTNTAQVRSFRTADASYVLLCQAEDREFDAALPVFRAMTFSLLKG